MYIITKLKYTDISSLNLLIQFRNFKQQNKNKKLQTKETNKYQKNNNTHTRIVSNADKELNCFV
jgi:hypothetical protein